MTSLAYPPMSRYIVCFLSLLAFSFPISPSISVYICFSPPSPMYSLKFRKLLEVISLGHTKNINITQLITLTVFLFCE